MDKGILGAHPKELQAFFDCPKCGREFARYISFRTVRSKYGVRFEAVFYPEQMCRDCMAKEVVLNVSR